MKLDGEQIIALGLLAGLGFVAWKFWDKITGTAGAVADAYRPGGIAYDTGNTVQDAIVPGDDSLGTWLYGLFNGDDYNPTPTKAPPVTYPGYPGGTSYPSKPGTANPWLPDYLNNLGTRVPANQTPPIFDPNRTWSNGIK